ncbi:MAG TPA: ABC transporter permease [Methylomirabilota bacterium]|nr:ABC transporter permease [Methylomirabilota bacterium]
MTPGIARPRLTRVVSRYGSVLMLAALLVAMSLATPEFAKVGNLLNVARQVSIWAIIGTGMTFVVITGGIDLSVGSLVALTACVAMTVIDRRGWDYVGILVGILVGGLGGAVNGALIAWARVPPFICTLAGLTVYRGLALIITKGVPIIKFEGSFRFIGQGVVGGIPVPIVLMAVVVAAMQVVLRRTAFGAHVYAVGGNEEASRLAGLEVARIKFSSYVLCGLLTGLAGMVLMARLSSAQPAVGEGFELDAIAAVVLGGTSLMGGRGSVWSTLVGALVIGILNNGMNLMGVHTHYQLVAKGVIIVLAVLLDAYLKKQR